MEYFRELVLPSLVADVQSLFWKSIYPRGVTNQNKTVKSFAIATDRSENKGLAIILDKYPFLKNHLLIFELPPKYATNIHMDGLTTDKTLRRLSCNIPVDGCNEHCITEFYKTDQSKFFANGTTRWFQPGEPKEKVAEYRLIHNVVLTNTQFPHRVNNLENLVKRISVSWSIDDDNWTFDGVAKYVAKTY